MTRTDDDRPASLPSPSELMAADRPIPFQATVGWNLTDWAPGRARIELDIDESRHGNRSGTIHGGIHMTLIDSACGFSGCYTGSPDQVQRCVTLSLAAHFVAPLQGRRLIAEAKVVGGGRRIFFADATIVDEEDRLVATGSGSFRYVGDKPPQQTTRS